MRMLVPALVAFLPLWLAAAPAGAVCLSDIDCIRQRFGQDRMLQQNRVLERARPAGARAHANRGPSVRRDGVHDASRTGNAPDAGSDDARDAVEVRPGVFYAPGGALGAPRIPGRDDPASDEAGPTIRRYQPAHIDDSANGIARPDQPAGAADLRHSTGRDR